MLPLASTASSVARVIVGAGLIAALLAFAVICAMKGKWVFFVLGWFSGIFWMVGAWRLAKPNSYWAKRRYGDAELTEAQLRSPADWSPGRKMVDDS
jgi:heme O synthase-like polyprenyltransferase